MRAFLRLVAGLGLLSTASLGACSSDDLPSASASESVLVPCPESQYGRACDPDLEGTEYQRCDGLCTFDKDEAGSIVCVPIADLGIASLEHYLCGAASACSQTCVQGQCVDVAAEDGTACVASAGTSACSGRCVSGACQPIAADEQCPSGPDTAGCGFRTCSALNATRCLTDPYPSTKACPLGTCDGCGVCGAAEASTCQDGGSEDASADGPRCGNGLAEASEQCDGNDLRGMTCSEITLGVHVYGTVSCTESCTFNVSQCTATPGSGGSAGTSASEDAGSDEGGEADAASDSGSPAGGTGGLGTGGTESGGAGAGGIAAGGTENGGASAGGSAGSAPDAGESEDAGRTLPPFIKRFVQGGGCDCRSAPARAPFGGQAWLAACSLIFGLARRRAGRLRSSKSRAVE